ncbi:MAG: DUF2752 domain-containing protein [Bacteroidales bacterium]|nr:DUF2752 domain-containing protein [Bacteroidales bacterium]
MQWYWNFVLWLENNQLPCFYKKYFHIECPGCGMQRALILLLKGKIWESIQTYPALLPMMLMVVLLIFHLLFKFKNGARILLYLFVINTAVIVVFYIFKILKQL